MDSIYGILGLRGGSLPTTGRCLREGVKKTGVPIASTIAEFELVKFREELQPVVAWDDGGSLRGIASDKVVVGWSQAEGFKRRGMFQVGPVLG
jgi:hypothetical protein